MPTSFLKMFYLFFENLIECIWSDSPASPGVYIFKVSSLASCSGVEHWGSASRARTPAVRLATLSLSVTQTPPRLLLCPSTGQTQALLLGWGRGVRGRVVISKTLIPWRFCSVLCWWWTFQTPARQAFYLLQKRCFHPFSLPFPPSLPLVTGLPVPKPLGVSLVLIKIITLCTWCECVCSCTCAMPNEWRPEENFVELTLSFYLYVASGIWTQVIGLQSKHHYWAKPSHWPIV